MSKTKVSLNASEISEKWNRRTIAAIPDAQRGVENVTVSPTKLAAAKEAKWLQGIQNAAQSGKWRNKLEAVSLEDWKSKTKQKMGERMAGGVQAAMDKRTKFDQANITILNEILPQIASMPDLTLQDSINRATQFMTLRSKKPYNG